MRCGPRPGRLTRRPSGWACCDAPSSGTWAGWKPTTPSCGSRSGRWRGRMPGGAGSTSAPWPWTRRAGCWPNSAPSPPTPRSGRCGAWPPRNWTATGAPTAWTTPGRRSIVGARVARDGRAAAAATRLAGEQADGTRRQPGRRSRGERAHRRGDRGQRPTVAAGQRHRVDPERLLGAEPRRQAPGRRRDWQAARAALERLAGLPPPPRPAASATATGPAAAWTAPVGRQERDGRVAGRREQHMGQHPDPDDPRPRRGRGPGGAGHAGLPGQRPVGAGPDRRGAPAVPGRPRRPARPAAGQRLGRPRPTRAPLWGSPDPSGAEPEPPGPQPSAPAEPAAGSLGSPGRSALAQYRRRRAAELAAWTRSLAWRAPLVAAAGLAG